MACCLSGYSSQASRIFLNSPFVMGFISEAAILTGFIPSVGSLLIQSDIWQKRKKALVFSSFLRAAKFLFGQVARNDRTLSELKSEMNTRPWAAANSCSCLNNNRNL